METYCASNHPQSATEAGMTHFYQGYIEFAGTCINSPFTTYNDFLMVYGGKIWLLCDFSAKEVVSYEALGSGRAYAMGVLFASTPKQGITKSLEAASEFDLYCHGPIHLCKIVLEEEQEHAQVVAGGVVISPTDPYNIEDEWYVTTLTVGER